MEVKWVEERIREDEGYIRWERWTDDMVGERGINGIMQREIVKGKMERCMKRRGGHKQREIIEQKRRSRRGEKKKVGNKGRRTGENVSISSTGMSYSPLLSESITPQTTIRHHLCEL